MHQRADPALFADVRQIGGETIAEVDHRGRKTMFAQVLSDGDAWRRREVLREISRSQSFSTTQAIESGD